MNKLIVRLFGGLGNQLFIYAASRRLALINNAELVIDIVSGFEKDLVYRRVLEINNYATMYREATFCERLFFSSPIFRRLLKVYNSFLPFERRNFIYENSMDFNVDLLGLKFRKTIYMEGYWQSESYFSDIKEIIKVDLSPKFKLNTLNEEMLLKINSVVSVAVHVRHFDNSKINEKSVNYSNNLNSDYYQNSIKYVLDNISNPYFFIFSDNFVFANDLFSEFDVNYTLVDINNSEISPTFDLYLMSSCKHFIIANSTFSWWGAWLSKYQNKIVISPRLVKNDGVSSWGFKGLIPDNWIKI